MGWFCDGENRTTDSMMGRTGHGIVLRWREQDNRFYDGRNRTWDSSAMERTGQQVI